VIEGYLDVLQGANGGKVHSSHTDMERAKLVKG
jgi:hypothetical protein